MNPRTVGEAVRLASAYDKSGVVVAPPFVFLESVGLKLKKASLGAQDLFWEEAGPYTGEVSWDQLKRLKVRCAIVGHSERRRLGETDGAINKKIVVALKHGFKAILCVGERWAVRKKGVRSAKAFVASQLKKDLAGVRRSKELIVAYEPVWAIGTGKNDHPESASEMASFIKSRVRGVRVLYGGSVNGRNARSFLKMPDIDGLLVGGASLRIGEFSDIIRAARQ